MPHEIKVLNRDVVPKDTLVIKEGTRGSRAFMIERGRVEVFVYDSKNNKVVLAELGPESIVGEMATLNDELRTANVRTLDDCVLIYISAHELQESFHKSQGFAARLKSMISHRKQDRVEKILEREEQLLQRSGLTVLDGSAASDDILLLTNKVKEGLKLFLKGKAGYG